MDITIRTASPSEVISASKNSILSACRIKRLLEQGELDQAEIELYDAIHKAERTTHIIPLPFLQ